LARLIDPGYRARPERAILFTVEAWDVNCSQHITARFTEAEIEGGHSHAARSNRGTGGGECATARGVSPGAARGCRWASHFGVRALFRACRRLLMFNAKGRPAWTMTTTTIAISAASSTP